MRSRRCVRGRGGSSVSTSVAAEAAEAADAADRVVKSADRVGGRIGFERGTGGPVRPLPTFSAVSSCGVRSIS